MFTRLPKLSYCGGGDGDLQEDFEYQQKSTVEAQKKRYSPVAIRGDDIVNTKLLTDFFNAKMQRIGFELLISEIGHDHGRQAHEASSLVFLSITPTVALLAPFDAVCRRVSCNRQKLRLF